MFVQVQLLKESPAELSFGKMYEETVTRVIDSQVSHHVSSRMGENRV